MDVLTIQMGWWGGGGTFIIGALSATIGQFVVDDIRLNSFVVGADDALVDIISSVEVKQFIVTDLVEEFEVSV
jgi:hypothetical protein